MRFDGRHHVRQRDRSHPASAPQLGAGGGHASGRQDVRPERHPLVDPEVAARDLGERGLELVRLNLRQEADLPEVHAENGDVHLGDGSGRTQECPVSAQDGENVARLQLR